VQSPAQLLLRGAPAFIFCVPRGAAHATYFSHNRFIIFNTPCGAADFKIHEYLGNISIFCAPAYFLIKIHIPCFSHYQNMQFVLVCKIDPI
jgi:hypothetical protein